MNLDLTEIAKMFMIVKVFAGMAELADAPDLGSYVVYLRK